MMSEHPAVSDAGHGPIARLRLAPPATLTAEEAMRMALHDGICCRWDGLCYGRSPEHVIEQLHRLRWRLERIPPEVS